MDRVHVLRNRRNFQENPGRLLEGNLSRLDRQVAHQNRAEIFRLPDRLDPHVSRRRGSP